MMTNPEPASPAPSYRWGTWFSLPHGIAAPAFLLVVLLLVGCVFRPSPLDPGDPEGDGPGCLGLTRDFCEEMLATPGDGGPAEVAKRICFACSVFDLFSTGREPGVRSVAHPPNPLDLCMTIPVETCLQPSQEQERWARAFGYPQPELAPEICRLCASTTDSRSRAPKAVPAPVPSYARWEHQARRSCAPPLKAPCSSRVDPSKRIPDVPSLGAVRREEILARYPGMIRSLSCEVLDSGECRLGWAAHMATGFVFELQFVNREAAICNGWEPTAETLIDIMYSSDRDSCTGAYTCLPHCQSPTSPSPAITLEGPAEVEIGEEFAVAASWEGCIPGEWAWEVEGGACRPDGQGPLLALRCSQPGPVEIEARASGCAGASGSTRVQVRPASSQPPPGPGVDLTLLPGGELVHGPPPPGSIQLGSFSPQEPSTGTLRIHAQPSPEELDLDLDGVPDGRDNCPPPPGESCDPPAGFERCEWFNPGQAGNPRDNDTVGMACDLCPTEDGPPPNGCPKEPPSGPPPASLCPAGAAACFESPGVFHSPTPADPVRRLSFSPPPGRYASLRMTLAVEHGGWAATNPAGTHNLFWLVRDRNRDMFGYANARRDQVFLRHGFGQRQGEKARVTRQFSLQPGETYVLDYLYNAADSRVALTLNSAAGETLTLLESTPNTDAITFLPGQRILVDFGFPEGTNPNEAPTYGWSYRNLVLHLER